MAFRSLINRSRAGVAGPLMMARTPSHTFQTQGKTVRGRGPAPGELRRKRNGSGREGDSDRVAKRGGQSGKTSSVDDSRRGTNRGGKDRGGRQRRRGSRPGTGRSGGGEGAPVGQWGGDGGGRSPACLGVGAGGGAAARGDVPLALCESPIGPGGRLCLTHYFHGCFAGASAELRVFFRV